MVRIVVAAAFPAALVAAVAFAAPPDRQGRAEVGRPLPRVASVGVDPNTADSSERLLKLPGTRGLLVQFWATWCGPCVAELDQLARAKDRLDAAGVRVLLVDLLDDREKVARFVQEHRLDGLPLIWDGSGAIVGEFGLEDPVTKKLALPLSIVADGRGVVRAIMRGGDGDHVGRVLDALR